MNDMKSIKYILVALSLLTYYTASTQNTIILKSATDSASYALGLNFAKEMKRNFNEVDKKAFMAGIESGIDSANVLMNEDEIKTFLTNFFKERRERVQEEKYAHIKKEGEDFLQANKTKQGVKTTPSGLQYIVLKNGNGEKPKVTDKIKAHYHGTSVDGTVFDSSVERGEPLEIKVNQVIKGWTEGLQLMPVGSKFKFFIPYNLAYGASPNPRGKIKPYEMLIFEVELLDIIE